MTPKCCKNCRHVTAQGGCKIGGHLNCTPWRLWFSKEWAQIQKAAEIIKKNNERVSSSDRTRTT